MIRQTQAWCGMTLRGTSIQQKKYCSCCIILIRNDTILSKNILRIKKLLTQSGNQTDIFWKFTCRGHVLIAQNHQPSVTLHHCLFTFSNLFPFSPILGNKVLYANFQIVTQNESYSSCLETARNWMFSKKSCFTEFWEFFRNILCKIKIKTVDNICC